MNYTVSHNDAIKRIYRVAVKFGDIIIGYRVYQSGGLFNTLVFKGYEWK
jgi:hypothetical protein